MTDKNFEQQVMLYLRNLAAKFHHLSEQVAKVHSRLDVLESVLMEGFRATSTAFNQTKTVCQAIVNETRETKEQLEEYGGVIEGSSYFGGTTRIV